MFVVFLLVFFSLAYLVSNDGKKKCHLLCKIKGLWWVDMITLWVLLILEVSNSLSLKKQFLFLKAASMTSLSSKKNYIIDVIALSSKGIRTSFNTYLYNILTWDLVQIQTNLKGNSICKHNWTLWTVSFDKPGMF